MFRRLDRPAVLISEQLDVTPIEPPAVLVSQEKFDRIIGSRIARERALFHEQLDELERQLAELREQHQEARS